MKLSVIVSYRASQLPKELLDASEVVIVTSESSAVEAESFRQLCRASESAEDTRWSRALSRLGPKQAAALPVTEECGGELRIFTMAPRLTPHVRHRDKYADVPVPDPRAFVFGRLTRRPTCNGLSPATAWMRARRGRDSRDRPRDSGAVRPRR